MLKYSKLPTTNEKVYIKFKTTDGEYHTSIAYRWSNCLEINYSIMDDIKNRGCIQDENGGVYPLSDVISVERIDKDDEYMREF